MALSWRHHALIQSLLSRGPLPEPDLHSIFSAVTGKNPAPHRQLFNDFLLKINKELAFVQFELRACRNQYDGKVYFGVVNNVADEQSKLGTKYSILQIAFYKALIEAIIQDISTQGYITNIEALNVRLDHQVQTAQDSVNSQSHNPPALKKISLSQKEKTLHDLIHDGWLCSMSDGKIGLGIRSFLDLRSWFRSNDIPSCDACNEAGIKAAMCPNEDCTVRIHDYCLKKKFSRRKIARVCPGCSTEWPFLVRDKEVEEEEDTEVEQTLAPSAKPPSRKRLRSCRAETVEATHAQSLASSSLTNAHNQEVSSPETRKRLRTYITEAAAAAMAAKAGPSQPSVATRRNRQL